MKARIENMREWALMAAGRVRGMSFYAMSMAASAEPKSTARAQYVKAARDWHHEYIARLKEAQAYTDGVNPGYYVNREVR